MPSLYRMCMKSDGDFSHNGIGISETRRLYDYIACNSAEGEKPLVIESDDILNHADEILSLLCDRLHVQFDRESMLNWEKSQHAAEGLFETWKEWHGDVVNSDTIHSDQSFKRKKINGNGEQEKEEKGMTRLVDWYTRFYLPEYAYLKGKAYQCGTTSSIAYA